MNKSIGIRITGCKWLIGIMTNQIGKEGVNQKKLKMLIRKEQQELNGLIALHGDLDETTLVTEEFEEKYCVPANK